MIFLPLSSARHGVESCSAMRFSRASCAACSWRSVSSGCENLNPCALAGPAATRASMASIAKAQLGRIGVRTVPGAEGADKPIRIAQRGPEIHMAYSTGRDQDGDSRRCRLRLRVPILYRSALQVFLEKGNGPRPRQLGRRFVIPGRRIVVKAVIRAWVHVHLIFHTVRLERRLPSGPARIDPFVEAGVVDQKLRLDLG